MKSPYVNPIKYLFQGARSRNFLGVVLFLVSPKLIAVENSHIDSPGMQATASEGRISTTIRIMSPGDPVQKTAPKAPLGSLWKIFVYVFQAEIGQTENPYQCRGNDPEEMFCCKPGEIIERDLALAKSCSPYFSPERLNIDPESWKGFWKSQIPDSPTWLLNLAQLKPETRVNVDELLRSLLLIRKNARTFSQIERAVVGTLLYGTAKNAFRTWGSTLRVKTYTWRDDETLSNQTENVNSHGFTGGFAGWLPDGAAIWASRAGFGREAFDIEVKAGVGEHLQTQNSQCVEVRFFDRYPIRQIVTDIESPLGPTIVKFENGNQTKLMPSGSLKTSKIKGQFQITGRFSLNEYVARVIDREVETKPLEAARAFSIAIRTYLFQNAKTSKSGCLEIGDSSHHQRVSPDSPSTNALTIANWSDGLTLDRVPALRYHSTHPNENRMAWSQAKSLAQAGLSAEEILKASYPTGLLGFNSNSHSMVCVETIESENWIRQQTKNWRKTLEQEIGFEKPLGLKVCDGKQYQFNSGSRVFAEMKTQTVFVPRLLTREDERSILHEYLHIGFRDHPRGQDEKFIEKLAARLLEEQ